MTSSRTELELSFLDQQKIFRVYVRRLFFFPFPNANQAEIALSALRHGLAATLCRYPYLAGNISLRQKSHTKVSQDFASECSDRKKSPEGILCLTYRDPIKARKKASHILNSEYDHLHDADLHFQTLEKNHFPLSCFPARIFCPDLLRNHAGLDDDDTFAERSVSFEKDVPLPAFAAQATFIPSGLVLSVWVFQALTDGRGIAHILAIWSEEVRAFACYLNDLSTIERETVLSNEHHTQWLRQRYIVAEYDPSAPRRALGIFAHRLQREGHAVTHLRRPPRLRDCDYIVSTGMFRFDSDVLSVLCNNLSSRMNQSIVPFVAGLALLWSHIVQARSSLLTLAKYSKVTLAIEVDLRKYVGYPYDRARPYPLYIGNLTTTAKCLFPLTASPILSGPLPTRIITAEDLLPFVLKIASTIHNINGPWALERLQDIKSSGTAADAEMRYSNGPDLHVTSWHNTGTHDDWCIPGTASASPSASIRAARINEGAIVILPRSRETDAPFEILITLAEEDLRLLQAGLERGNWLM